MSRATAISVLVFLCCLYNISADLDIGDNVDFINIRGIENEDVTCNIPKSFTIRLNGKIEVNPKNDISKNIIEPVEDRSSKNKPNNLVQNENENIPDDKFEKMLQYCTDSIGRRLENIENNVEFKPVVGVRYKLSDIKNGSSTNTVPRSCKEILENGYNTTGLYQIRPRSTKKPIVVLCDMDTKGGGWTHIQKRFDGSQDFFLDWREYKFGFGDLDGEFWIGLENIYKMTALEINELLVEVEDRDGKVAYAHYKSFGIGSEPEGYILNVLKGYSGDAGDSMSYHIGHKFSTKDFDQDEDSGNCAQQRSGAWWYKNCFESNLNGKYLNVPLPSAYEYEGLHWETFHDIHYSHAKSRMLIKPA